MKKLLLALAAVAVLASCSKENGIAPSFGDFEDAIKVSAYVSTPVVRGTVQTIDNFQTKGFGVFAFYQPSVNGNEPADYTTIKYPTPNFMYNQQITFSSSDAKWSYTPIKYWPNNVNDKLTFFAYAPYSLETVWEDLGINTDATGKTLTKTFIVYNGVDDQQDYLFAAPSLNINRVKSTTDGISQDGIGQAKYGLKASADAKAKDVIYFDFKHVMSKVNLYVGVNVDVNTPESGSVVSGDCAAKSWEDPNTEIEINSIEFKGLYQTYTWTYNSLTEEENWEGDGKQNIVVEPSANDHADKIDDDNWADAKWHRVLAGTKEETNEDDEYMFIAPQDELDNAEIVITYTVKTKDSSRTNKLNDSEITNVITKTWDDFKNAGFTKFESGKQYRLYFMIGMQSVKLAASITDWEDASDPESVLDVPRANAF